MRALELDPAHFFKVGQEPVHHERRYFSDDDASEDFDSEDQFYEDLIGHDKEYRDYSDIAFSSEEDMDPNDIQFSINEDVQFKLDTSDNYEGRDIDIGITMPDDFTGSKAAAGGG